MALIMVCDWKDFSESDSWLESDTSDTNVVNLSWKGKIGWLEIIT